MEAIAVLVTPRICYLGVLQGKVHAPLQDIGAITHQHFQYLSLQAGAGSSVRSARLEDVLSFPIKGTERNPDTYAEYLFFIQAGEQLFVNQNYLHGLRKRSLLRKIRRCSKLNAAALGRGKSYWSKFRHNIHPFIFDDREFRRREMITNPIRIDDRASLRALGSGQTLIYGGVPVHEDEHYLVLARESAQLRCSKINVTAGKRYPARALLRARARRQEILAGGCYFADRDELIISYLKPGLKGYHY
ncbi:hypothetical protein HY491_01360 [Candidatus Woesearchaeota archaeon]|nr:hypothetical protein [Candidatus Woesearchaeota archaeon]